MTTQRETVQRDTTGILSMVLGVVLIIGGAWALSTERIIDITLAIGLALVLYGLGKRRGSRALLVSAYVVPGAILVLALLGLAFWPALKMSLIWRVLCTIAAVGVAVGLSLFVRANRHGSDLEQPDS